MLTITIPGEEFYNEETNEFSYENPVILQMEHSLISISKWEAKWHRAFLAKKERNAEETLDYFKCMTVNKVDPKVYKRLSQENVEEILNYINEPMTATYMGSSKFGPGGEARAKDTTTAELLYYYMIALGIPFECEKWHLNRLLALIHVCEVKNSAGNKTMSRSQLNKRNASLNAARRKAHGTKG